MDSMQKNFHNNRKIDLLRLCLLKIMPAIWGVVFAFAMASYSQGQAMFGKCDVSSLDVTSQTRFDKVDILTTSKVKEIDKSWGRFVSVETKSGMYPGENNATTFFSSNEIRIAEIYREVDEGYYASDLLRYQYFQAIEKGELNLTENLVETVLFTGVENNETISALTGLTNNSSEIREIFLTTPLGRLLDLFAPDLGVEIDSVAYAGEEITVTMRPIK